MEEYWLAVVVDLLIDVVGIADLYTVVVLLLRYC